MFTYAEGDGNDIISGFNATSTLQIGDGTGTYSTEKNGDDIIVTVGDGKITLQGAVNLSTVNISGNEVNPTWTLNGTIATYGTSTNTLFTVTGVKSTSGLSLNGSTVTVAASALNKSNVTISNGYKLVLADDVTIPSTTAAGWSLSGKIATYKAASTSAGYTLNNNQIVYTAASGGESFTVNGVKSTEGLSLSGTTVTVSNSALNKSNVIISSGYKLALADDVANPSTTAASWTLDGTTATYKAASTSAGYKISNNNQIVYTSASGGGTLATIKGVTSTEGLTLKNGVITLKPTALSKNVSISGGYKYNLAAGDYGKGKINATKLASSC